MIHNYKKPCEYVECADLPIRSMKRTSALESKANIQDRKLNELQLLFISLLLFMFLLLLIAIVWQVLKGYFIGY